MLTGYGTLGTTAPVAPAASLAGVLATPGSGDTTSWTVVDPQGAGICITPVPSQTGTVWQVNLIGQSQARAIQRGHEPFQPNPLPADR